MFVLDPAAICCCAVTCCCGVGSVCAYRKRQSIPHPSECALIGKMYRLCGCHDHDKFDVLIEIHEIHDLTQSGKFFVEVHAGRSEERTGVCSAKKGRVEIQERVNIHVRQADKTLTVRVKKQGLTSTEAIGDAVIGVKSELIDGAFPKRQSFFCQKDGKTACKIVLSFHRLDTGNVSLGDFQMSPLLHQALLIAQSEAEARGETLQVDILNMTEVERLRFLSKVLEGPLKQMSSIGGAWKNLYFRAAERRNGKWEWQYWSSKDDCMSGIKKRGAYSFMAISLVLPDKHDRHCFYIRYHDTGGVHDLFFKRVDRDRNLWSDGLFEFIEKLREYLEKHPEVAMSGRGGHSSRREKKKEGDVGGSRTPRKRDGKALTPRTGASDDAGDDGIRGRSPHGSDRRALSHRSFVDPAELAEKRRVLSPRETAADEMTRPRASVLKGRMIEGLMYDRSLQPGEKNEEASEADERPRERTEGVEYEREEEQPLLFTQ
ncbi:transmembrane protein [Toxoplasma gondii TgCatPRC2]|uniref:Transmembrane protein n=2 Tax=Toxoplasma gondii TaxID=5811 RepID=A0A151HQA7_TOXGO|nr:transmembrane protein [Toxoplasma gondii ARI]KYK71533.1 transmembrane protein [Toxoplasma gondii TgCatPRC2]